MAADSALCTAAVVYGQGKAAVVQTSAAVRSMLKTERRYIFCCTIRKHIIQHAGLCTGIVHCHYIWYLCNIYPGAINFISANILTEKNSTCCQFFTARDVVNGYRRIDIFVWVCALHMHSFMPFSFACTFLSSLASNNGRASNRFSVRFICMNVLRCRPARWGKTVCKQTRILDWVFQKMICTLLSW